MIPWRSHRNKKPQMDSAWIRMWQPTVSTSPWNCCLETAVGPCSKFTRAGEIRTGRAVHLAMYLGISSFSSHRDPPQLASGCRLSHVPSWQPVWAPKSHLKCCWRRKQMPLSHLERQSWKVSHLLSDSFRFSSCRCQAGYTDKQQLGIIKGPPGTCLAAWIDSLSMSKIHAQKCKRENKGTSCSLTFPRSNGTWRTREDKSTQNGTIVSPQWVVHLSSSQGYSKLSNILSTVIYSLLTEQRGNSSNDPPPSKGRVTVPLYPRIMLSPRNYFWFLRHMFFRLCDH